MNFAEAAKANSHVTYTENGAVALNTTSSGLLDFFSVIGALRQTGKNGKAVWDKSRAERLFAEALKEDALLATKILFYARDVREGLGERDVPRSLMVYAAKHHPELLINNLDLIGVYGRYDDLYSFIGTPLEDAMWEVMFKQFEEDKAALADGKAISLLAKWIKTPDASSPKTRQLGIKTALKLGYTVPEFKRILKAMRKHLKIVESLMSAGRWDEIEYSAVPSRAMMIYRKAFEKHDEDRFNEFTNKAVNGEAKINSSTLYPYDLVEKIFGYRIAKEDATVEAQWRQLPNYIEPGQNVMIVADTSGSMIGRPMNSALGLAIYFAERNVGPYHNLWMSFSADAHIHELKGETLVQKINSIDMSDWDANTDLERAFEKILDIAVENKISQDEMPKSIVVITDMEIDAYCYGGGSIIGNWTFYDEMAARFERAGYSIPGVVFWNVASRHDTYHADAHKKGVQLVSGHSTSTFKNLLGAIDKTPYELMLSVLNSERYEAITINR